METLVVVIIILVAVLSTPLSLKKLIDHANRRKAIEQPQEQKPAQLPDDKTDAPSSDKWDDDWNDF